MDDDGTANRRFRIIREGNLMIYIIQLRVAGSVCFHIAHIAFVPCGCVRPGMRLVAWIEMGASRAGIGCAAIAKFVDMKTVFARRQPRNFRVDLHAISNRSECNRAANFVARGGMQH